MVGSQERNKSYAETAQDYIQTNIMLQPCVLTRRIAHSDTPTTSGCIQSGLVFLLGAVWPAGMLAAAAQAVIAPQGGTLMSWHL